MGKEKLSDLVKSDYSELTTDEQGQIRGGFGLVSKGNTNGVNAQNNCACGPNNCICWNNKCKGVLNNCTCSDNNCNCGTAGDPTTPPSSGIPGGLVMI